jgi:hypothetical protein
VTAAARIRLLRGGVERSLDVAAGPVTIGRAPGQSVRIIEEAVAAEHAVLHLGDRWLVEARGGALAIDGAPLPAGGRAPLRRGAHLALAGWTLIVEEPPPGAAAADPVRTASLARELVRDLLGGEAGAAAPSLRIEEGPAAGQRLPLPPPPGRLVIGRGDEADVIVLDRDLSRRHLAFTREVDGVRVLDLGSKNGTWLAGQPVGAKPPGRLLAPGDRVVAGATALRLVDPAEDYLRELDERLPRAPTDAAPVVEIAGEPTSPTTSLRLRPDPPAEPAAPAPPGPASLVPVIVAVAIAVAALVGLVLLLAT